MPQLVGLGCLLCNARITSALEGEFCTGCGGPVHLQCARASAAGAERCPTCGADAETAASFRQRAGEQEAVKRSQLRGYRVGWGIMGMIGGIALMAAGVVTVLASVASEGRIVVIWYGAILAGAAIAIRGATLLFTRPRVEPRDDGAST